MPSLVVDIQAKFAQFEQSLKRIEGSADSTASRISGAFTSVQTVLAGLGAGVAVAGLVNFAKAGIDAAASLEDLSEKTTLSVEFLSQLQVVTARTGDSLESVAQNAGRFARSAADRPLSRTGCLDPWSRTSLRGDWRGPRAGCG